MARDQHVSEAACEMETVVQEHESALLRYAARLLASPEAAQDVVQEVFIKLFRGWRDGVRPTRSLKSWLYRATHNHAVDYIRRESRLRVLHQTHAIEQDPAVAPAQGEALGREEAMGLALDQLSRLGGAERQVVLLRLQEGLSYREIAEITGRTESHVGVLLHTAVKKLASGLRAAGVEERP